MGGGGKTGVFIRVCALVALTLACVLGVVFAGGVIGWLPLFVLALTLVISVALLAYASKRVAFSVTADQASCLRGQTVTFSVQAENPTLLPFLYAIALVSLEGPYPCDATSQWHACLFEGRGARQFHLSAKFAHVGVYHVGLTRVRVYDILGLFWRTIEQEKAGNVAQVTVLPHTGMLDDVEIKPIALIESLHMAAPIANEGMDYVGVRDYYPGDPIKAVHWKLTARKGDMHTRLYELFTNPGISVFIQFESYEYTDDELARANDMVIEAAFSLMAQARDGGFEAEALFLDQSGEMVRLGSADFEEAASVLALMPNVHVAPDGGLRFSQLVEEQAANPQRQSTFAVVTPAPEANVVEAALATASLSRNPVLYACIPVMDNHTVETDRLRPLSACEAQGVYCQRLKAPMLVDGSEGALAQ